MSKRNRSATAALVNVGTIGHVDMEDDVDGGADEGDGRDLRGTFVAVRPD